MINLQTLLILCVPPFFLQLLIGSTRLLKADDLFNEIFLQDNLFPALH